MSRPSGQGLRSYNGAWATGLAEGNARPRWGISARSGWSARATAEGQIQSDIDGSASDSSAPIPELPALARNGRFDRNLSFAAREI